MLLFFLLFTLPVVAQSEAKIISYEPSNASLQLEEDTNQKFRITASLPVGTPVSIDRIEFYAKDAKGWDRKKKSCPFFSVCYSFTGEVIYGWGKAGIYNVTAKVFDTTGKVRRTHAWSVSVGNQLSEEEINQLFEEANRPRAEIRIQKAQARNKYFAVGQYLNLGDPGEFTATVGDKYYFEVEAACDDGIEFIEFSNRNPSRCWISCDTHSVTKGYTFDTVGQVEIVATVKSKEDVLHNGTRWIVNVVPERPKSPDLTVRVSRVDQDISTVVLGLSLSGDYIEVPHADPDILAPGDEFQLEATVRNTGSEKSGPTNLRFYRSSDSNISADNDTELRGMGSFVRGLKAGEEIKITPSRRFTVPTVPGVYYYGACVDSRINESDVDNNCSAAIAITARSSDRPDLVIGPVSVNKTALAPGESFRLNTTVRNQGTVASTPTTLRFYQSSNSDISANDTELHRGSVKALNVGGQITPWRSFTAPNSPGTYYYGVCVDDIQGESNTSNNCSEAVFGSSWSGFVKHASICGGQHS